MELNVFDSCLISEELSYGCAGITTAIKANTLGVRLCLLFLSKRRNHFDSELSNAKKIYDSYVRVHIYLRNMLSYLLIFIVTLECNENDTGTLNFYV